jgi:hypothetical protein
MGIKLQFLPFLKKKRRRRRKTRRERKLYLKYSSIAISSGCLPQDELTAFLSHLPTSRKI